MSVDITRLTAHLSPEQQDEVKRAYRRRHENSTAAFLWCFFFGTLGAHRFYLKQWGAGFLRLLVPLIAAAVIVAGIVFNLQPAIIVAVVVVLLLIALLWEIIDLFRIDQEVYNRNLKLAEQLIGDALLQDKSVERQADAKMENLMRDARAEAVAAAQAERQEVTADAAAAPPVEAAVAEREDAPASDATETVSAEDEQRSDAEAVAGDTYVAHTVNEISEDPNATQHAARYQAGPQNDWSATETVHAEDEQVRTAEDERTETTGEPGTIGDAGVALGTAAIAGYALDETITRTHGETDHSTADSLETHAALSAADAERQDEAVAVEASDTPPLAEEDAETPTWPEHPALVIEEPTPTQPQPATTFDVTDTSGISGGVKPIADIEPVAAPLIIALPALASIAGASDAEPEYTDTDAPLVEPTSAGTTDMFAADAPPAPKTGDAVPLLLVPMAENGETSFGGASSVDAPAQSAEEAAVPEESYIPPTVPVVTAEAAVEEPAVVAPAPQEAEPEQPEGETLAELAAFAGAAGAGIAAAQAHRTEDQPELQPTPEPTPEPAPVAEEPASTPEAVPVATAAAAPVAAEAAAVAAPQPRRQLRRIREHLQIKREGQVVEELIAEDLIEVDQDPEPARMRLRDRLHQQAVERGLE